jgi:hypothetical protein
MLTAPFSQPDFFKWYQPRRPAGVDLLDQFEGSGSKPSRCRVSNHAVVFGMWTPRSRATRNCMTSGSSNKTSGTKLGPVWCASAVAYD